MRLQVLALAFLGFGLFASSPAHADYRFCRETGNSIKACALRSGDYRFCREAGNSAKACSARSGSYDLCRAGGNSVKNCALNFQPRPSGLGFIGL